MPGPRELQYDREELYRTLWEHADKRGVLQLTQLQLMELVDIPYQRLSVLFHEYTWLGRMKKFGAQFMIYDPDRFEWGEVYRQEHDRYVAAGASKPY